MLFLRFLFLGAIFMATPAFAEPPRVSTGIAPVHSLVSQVMKGVGTPDLVVPAKASPHSYALRPSQAQALAEADLVIWMGPELTPWLEKPLETVASGAAQMRLLAVDGTITHHFREESEDENEDDHDDDHDHDHEGHDHSEGTDPHAWLDPENAKIWLAAIAETLSGIDPQNAETYRGNAKEAGKNLERLSIEIADMLKPVQSRAFVTHHDAFQYFEVRFGLSSAGTVSIGDATDPSPAQLAKLRDTLKAQEITCAFSEPQFNDRLLRAASGEQSLQIGVLDPIGSKLEPGPQLYATLLRDMAVGFVNCSS